jgi:uncharacterized protein YjbI with pentapeptide repeats
MENALTDSFTNERNELDEVELDEWQKCSDDQDYLVTGTTGYYYILVPQATIGNTIDLETITEQLTPEFLAASKTAKDEDRNLLSLYIDTEGKYCPDYLLVAGLDLVSQKFLHYLEYKFALDPIEYNNVTFVTKNGERIDNYCLLIPETIDCLMNVRYDPDGALTYFEVDPYLTNGEEIFRAPGFPYLIVTRKLNRIEFSGFKCQRIEVFFDYPAIREADLRERQRKKPLIAARDAFQTQANRIQNLGYVSVYTGYLERNNLAAEIGRGLQKIFDSFQGVNSSIDILTGYGLTFVLSLEGDCLELARVNGKVFNEWRISLDSLQPARDYCVKLPEILHAVARRYYDETVIYHLCNQGQLLADYPKIHAEQIMDLYLLAEGSESIKPLLIYRYLPQPQQQLANAQKQSIPDLNGKRLWRYDFSGKRWPELKINDADLQGARFDGAQLAKAEFVNCDLTEATFRKADLKQAKFTNCKLRRTNFDRADLRGAELAGSDLYHCSFIRSNLREAKIKNQRLEKVYFEQANLFDAVFEAPGPLVDGVFRLCDLRGAKFIGAPEEIDNIIFDCDFRNSDLTGCCFDVYRISKGIFTRTLLSHASFASCNKITLSDFRWAVCVGMDLGQIEIYNCDFSFVDLSKMKTMKGSLFAGNNFAHTNLSRYSFKSGYWFNHLVCTNLSDCNLEGVDFTSSYLIFPNFTGAILKEVRFSKEQMQYVINLTSMQRNGIVIVSE